MLILGSADMGIKYEVSGSDELSAKLKELNGKKVNIGIVGKSDSALLTYAAVNEYGANIKITPKMRKFLAWKGLYLKKDTTHIIIPERSYIRSTFDNKKTLKAMEAEIIPTAAKVALGKLSPVAILDYIGLYYTSAIKKTIADMREPENHPFTSERKGSSKGLLIDSGRLLTAISYEVV